MRNSRKRHKEYDEEGCHLDNLSRNRADYYDVKLIKMNENENKLFC